MIYADKPKSMSELLCEHRKNNGIIFADKLNFEGADGFDVYNICQTFEADGKIVLAGRVEKRDSELSSIKFFEQKNVNTFTLIEDISLEKMQDPCFCEIDNQMIVGGTEIFTDENGKINNWRTSFFRGKTLATLVKFANAPEKMKDVRLAKTNNKLYVFSRPQGGKARFGKIGYASCENLDDINEEFINGCELLENNFDDKCWGGANQILPLKNGCLGIVGHVATMSDGDVRHYYGMVFCFNPTTKEYSNIKIICERSDFKAGEFKRKDLIDVVFLGGLNRNSDGTATIYTGTSDAEAHYAIINDPFLEYENC